MLHVFQDRIYWTDRDRAAVFMANRLTGQDIHTLAENLNDPHDIVVFHQLRQPQGVCVQHEQGRLCVCSFFICFPPLAVIVLVALWVYVEREPWINDTEAGDCGGVIKALGAAEHSHICQNPASNLNFTNRTIQIWVGLKEALNHECDGRVFPYLCVIFNLYPCLSVSTDFFLLVHAHLYFNLAQYFITFPLWSLYISVFLSLYQKCMRTMRVVPVKVAEELFSIYCEFLYVATFYSLYSFRLFFLTLMGFVERKCDFVHSGELLWCSLTVCYFRVLNKW